MSTLTPRPPIVVAHCDHCTHDLLREWLADDGYGVVADAGTGPVAQEQPAAATLVIIDIAYPRHDGPGLVDAIARRYPGAPVLALSSAFFGNVECCGAVARSLGVAGVVPKPVSREALRRAVRQVLPPQP